MSDSTTSHDAWLKDQLAHDDEFVAAYLQVAFEECSSPEEILLALRTAVEARGISCVATKIGIARESLSRALSASGNPTLKTLHGVLQSMGLRFTVSQAIQKEVEWAVNGSMEQQNGAISQPSSFVIANVNTQVRAGEALPQALSWATNYASTLSHATIQIAQAQGI